MAKIVNLSPFAAQNFFAADSSGRDLLVVCVAGHFNLPPAGKVWEHELALAEQQTAPPMTDVYWGEPGTSSLRYEGQSAYHRPGTDIYVNGHAQPLAGRRVQRLGVRVQVGRMEKTLAVFGDRVWQRGWSGMRISEPTPFERMAIRYERSFGGAAGSEAHQWEPRNPIGCGLYASASAACDRLLPNIEDPEQLIEHWSDRVAPSGLGPVCRSWAPRLGLAGSYDASWEQSRAPLWPSDFDPHFFHAAAPGLAATPGLVGGEPVYMEGLSPDGAWAFHLPRRRLIVVSNLGVRRERQLMKLDAVQLEPDMGLLTLIWRSCMLLDRELTAHRYSVVRELDSLEEAPS